MVGAVVRSVVLRLATAAAVAAAVVAPLVGASAPLQAQADVAPTPCLTTLVGTCVNLSGPSSSDCILVLCPTPSPTPATDPQSTNSSGPCDQLPTCPSPQPTCLLTDPTNTTCLLATPSPSACATCSPSPHSSGTPSHSSRPTGTSTARATSDAFTGASGGLSDTPGASPSSAGTAIPIGIQVPPIPEIQPVGAASALHFGHAPILWPLFGALDLVGLAGVFLVLRRVRARRPD